MGRDLFDCFIKFEPKTNKEALLNSPSPQAQSEKLFLIRYKNLESLLECVSGA